MSDETPVLSRRARRISILNATVLYVLSFMMVHMVVLSITWFLSTSLGIEARILYNRVVFLTEYDYQIWTIDAIVAMFFAGPFIAIILAGFFSRLNTVNRFDQGWSRMFYLYVFFHGVNFSFGALMAGALSQEVLWYAFAWLRVPQIMMYFIGVGGLVAMFYLGQSKIMSIYEASIFHRPNDSFNRQEWLLNALLKAWLFGGIIIALVFIPGVQRYLIYLLIFPIVMFAPAFVRSRFIPEAVVIETQTHERILWFPLILLILSLTLIRVFLVM